MIGVILGVGIPILYIAMGCATGIFIYDRKPDKNCRLTKHASSCNVNYPSLGKKCDCSFGSKGHADFHDCDVAAAFGGAFWPIAGIFIVVYALMHGKSPRGTRMRRYQKRVQRVQRHLEEMEKELGLS